MSTRAFPRFLVLLLALVAIASNGCNPTEPDDATPNDATDPAEPPVFLERDGSVGYYANYYVVEYRAYWGYDKNLQVGPYNFGFLDIYAVESGTLIDDVFPNRVNSFSLRMICS